ncbi:PEP-CTERM sorting domain-containing protein [Halieaceae bacterium IMCC14734]|uniref:PEP-CTERM sorting domain-containing protein n=1 Tax=Candidatus Litorirhabdus singularis TaxID=2518993 RepID=A0ABT3TMA0_9GAMM|nr:PEP-CTERM sorting domain-containing protein [Candidatus Litorirhabdus singularis]MCX2983415.1 PEP-CTERM sorting domain-containing protein [Candidatus Litorirhabdus singularis]
MLNKLRLLTLAILFHATASWATPMDYALDIDWTSGGLSGTSSTIFLTLDELTSTSYVVFKPGDAAGSELVSFEVTIDGLTFTEASETEYAGAYQARVGFLADMLDFIDYTGRGPGTLLSIDFVDAGSKVNRVLYTEIGANEIIGVIDASSLAPVDRVDVPVPATLALFGLGLVGLGITRRKRETHG